MPDWMAALRPDPQQADDPVPRSFAATVAAARAALGDDAVTWAVRCSAGVCDELEGMARTLGGELVSDLREASEAALLTLLIHLRDGTSATALPAEMRQGSRRAARIGVRLDTPLRLIWLSHAGVQNALLDVVADAVPLSSSPRRPER